MPAGLPRPRAARNGNDHKRGLDVHRFDAGAAASATQGTLLTAAQATPALSTRKATSDELAAYRMACLLAQ